MPDALGWRCKFAVVAPSTNTVVQPEFDGMRPLGVTNHFGRIAISNMSLTSNEDFIKLMSAIESELYQAIDRCMTCEPDYLLMGMSAVMFWGGYDAAAKRREEIEQYTGLGVSSGSFAVEAALKLVNAKRIAVLSPYQPVSDEQVTRFFTECGFEVVRFKGLRCPTPVAISHVQGGEIRGHLASIDGEDVDALVQVGTNLSMACEAVEAERQFSKSVIAINTATYWHGLRAQGVDDKVDGYGPLLLKY